MSSPPAPVPLVGITYPVEPNPVAAPSTVALNYGDPIYIYDLTNNVWIGTPSQFVSDTNSYGEFSIASSLQNAQQFVIAQPTGGGNVTVPVGSTGLPNGVLYGDTVQFLTVGASNPGY